jgi:hypothetical protein
MAINEKKLEEIKRLELDSTIAIPDSEDYVEEISGFIYISLESSIYDRIIKIQKTTRDIENRLKRDKYGQKLLSFENIRTKRNYLEYMRKNKFLSNVAIYRLSEDILSIIVLQYDSAELLLSTQEGEMREKIFPHIKKLRYEKELMAGYIKHISQF